MNDVTMNLTTKKQAKKQSFKLGMPTTIRGKIIIALVSVLVLITVVLMSYIYTTERNKNLNQAISQVKGMNSFYFASLNTLMLADGMEEREELRNKFLNFPNVNEIRVLRGEHVNKREGKGYESEQPVDELDYEALKAVPIVKLNKGLEGRTLTVIEPYFFSKDFGGTDCLECHRKAKEGVFAGAIRIDYSLKTADAHVELDLWKKFAIVSFISTLALIMLIFIINRIIVSPTNELRDKIKDIAEGEGDLTQTIKLNGHSDDELGQVTHWFNFFMTKLREMVQKVIKYATELSTFSESMNGIIQQANDSMLQQQRETSQVAQSMNHMAESVQSVSDISVKAVKLAQEANQEAKNGKVVVEQTIETIDKLSESVGKASLVIQHLESESTTIASVLDVIGSIASQTNLLALNAAIEAARAGEQGRGFAVVADEVRTLAERTQKSTQEIQEMIERLQQGTKDAVNVMTQSKEEASVSVEQVAKAGRSLDAIAQSVSSITSMNTVIADEAEKHREVSNEIKDRLSNINESVSGTVTKTQDLSTASIRLAYLADDLETLMKVFKV